MNANRANLMLLFVNMIWGLGFLVSDQLLEQLTPFYLMSFRFLGAAIIPILISRKKLLELPTFQFVRGAKLGCVLFLGFAFQTFGLLYATPGKAAFLSTTNVVFLPYLLWLIWHKKPRKKELVASLICLVGVGCLTLQGSEGTMVGMGELLLVCCAVCFALQMILLERYATEMNAMAFTAIQMVCAGSISLVFAMAIEPMPHLQSGVWIGLGYLIFFNTFVAYFLQTIAQTYTTSNMTSLIMTSEAFFTVFFSYLFLQEEFTQSMLVGGCCILLSILILEMKLTYRFRCRKQRLHSNSYEENISKFIE